MKTETIVVTVIGICLGVVIFLIIPWGETIRDEVAAACLSDLGDNFEISRQGFLESYWYCHLETKEEFEYDFCIREVVETKNHGFRIITNTCEAIE